MVSALANALTLLFLLVECEVCMYKSKFNINHWPNFQQESIPRYWVAVQEPPLYTRYDFSNLEPSLLATARH